MAGEFGYVYILTNPSMPGLVKVGKTTNTPNQRMSELHSTGVPGAHALVEGVGTVAFVTVPIEVVQML